MVSKSASHRRTFRFSLRTMLVGVLFMCFATSWINSSVIRAWHQQQAAAKVAQLGGSIVYGYEYREGSTYRLVGSPIRPPGPVFLRNWIGIDALDSVFLANLESTEMESDDLVLLRGFPRLHVLSLDSSRITDAGMHYIRRLSDLRYLYLNCRGVTDDGLVHLVGCPQLERLQLGADVTDRGIEYLRRCCPKLKTLHLDCPRVTDAAIDDLLAMPNLEAIRIRRAGISEAGLNRLKKDFRVLLIPPNGGVRGLRWGGLPPMGW